MQDQFCRSALLLGEPAINKLSVSTVAVFGIGGVGSFAAEALARAGVGALKLIDSDTVAVSNINRQLIALHSTVGALKVEVAKDRLLDINPNLKIDIFPIFYNNLHDSDFLDGCSYIIDAIDTVSAKTHLIREAFKRNIPIISCMGAGNKLDPTKFEVADIFSTSVCPLCRVVRKELKSSGISSLKVIYSKEARIKPLENLQKQLLIETPEKRQIPGSVSFVPSVMGLIAAGEVIKELSSDF